MTYVDGCGTQFIDCKLQHTYMDEANFSGALFQNCDLSDTMCAHGNFTHATFMNCNVSHMAMWNSCIEGVDWTDTLTISLDTENCVDDETEWLGQQSGMDVST